MTEVSTIRQRAREVAEKADADRGSFKPRAGGVPLRIYEWWCRQTVRDNHKGGICSYFWIVVLWAPLLAVRLFFKRIFSHKATWIALGIAILTFLVWYALTDPASGLQILLGISVGVGFFVGLAAGAMVTVEDLREMDEKPPWWFWFICIVTLPGSLLGFVFVLVIQGVEKFFKMSHMRRFGRWLRDTRLIRGYVSPRAVLLLLVYFVAVTLLAQAGAISTSIAIVLAVAPVVIALIVWIVSIVGTRFERKRERAREQNREAQRRAEARYEAQRPQRLEVLFRLMYRHEHPELDVDETIDTERYNTWREAYIERLYQYGYELDDVDKLYIRYGGGSPLLPESVVEACRRQLGLIEDEQPAPVAVERKPSRVRSVFAGMGDFAILVAQYIRYWKLRICPMVELPSKASSSN